VIALAQSEIRRAAHADAARLVVIQALNEEAIVGDVVRDLQRQGFVVCAGFGILQALAKLYFGPRQAVSA